MDEQPNQETNNVIKPDTSEPDVVEGTAANNVPSENIVEPLNRNDGAQTQPIQPVDQSTPVLQQPEVETTSQPPLTNVSNGPSKTHKSFMIVWILLLVVAVGATAYITYQRRHVSKPKVVAVKKDIPVINYAISSSDVPQYPLTYPYTNNDIFIVEQMFEGLVGYKDQTKVVPLLATDWSNPNDTTWVFNLRQGVKFNDGRTMTANDVKYSLDYAVAHQNDDQGGDAWIEASTISDVKVTGTNQVTITTTSPDPVLLNRLAYLGIIDSKAKLGSYTAGTGPYIVKTGTTPTTSLLDLVANNNYWGGHVYTREVKIKSYTDTDKQAADASSGKLDLSGSYSSSQLSKIKKYTPIKIDDQGLSYIALNVQNSSSPVSSLAYRQAMSYAIDNTKVLKAQGYVGQQASQIVPVFLPGHNPQIANSTYDPIKAKALLATVKNASQLVNFYYGGGNTNAAASEIAKELNSVGFNIKPTSNNDDSTFFTDAFGGKYDMFMASDTSATVDGLDILNDLLQNEQFYLNPKIDTLIQSAGSSLNASGRITDMQQVATIVNTDKPIIPLYTISRVYALQNSSYVVKPDLPGLDSSVYFWKIYQQ